MKPVVDTNQLSLIADLSTVTTNIAKNVVSTYSVGAVVPYLPAASPLYTDFSTNKYYMGGYAYTVFTDWLADNGGTFTRGGTQHYYINASGYLVNGTANTPRYSYDPVTLNPVGIRYEASANNKATYSDVLSDPSTGWAFSDIGVTRSNNATIGLDGSTTNAGKITENSGSSSAHRVFYYQGTDTIVSGQNYVYQIFLKAAGRTKVQFVTSSLGFPDATIDLTAHTVTGTGWNIDQWVNGWHRVWTSKVSTVTGAWSLILTLLDASGASTYTGDGTSGIYVAGHMLEAASVGSRPSTYISRPTNVAVTRSADALSFNIPAGVSKLTYTLGDSSTVLVTGISAGTYTLPTNLGHSSIKSVIGLDLATSGTPVVSVAGKIGAVTLAQADVAGLTTVSSPPFAGLIITGSTISLNSGKHRTDGPFFQWTTSNTNANYSSAMRGQVIGSGAAKSMTTWSNSSIIGTDAAGSATTIATAVVLGDSAGGGCPSISNTVLIGNEAGNSSGTISSSNIIGNTVNLGGNSATAPCLRIDVVGQAALRFNSATDTVVMGNAAAGGVGGTPGQVNRSVILGSNAGNNLGNGNITTDNIIIGYNIPAPSASTSNFYSFGNVFTYLGSTSTVTIQTPAAGKAKLVIKGLAASTSYANDTAAAAGGVGIDEIYRNGSIVMVRVT
jgi:hypothetical protein